MKKVLGYLPTGGLETTEAKNRDRFEKAFVFYPPSAGDFRHDIVFTITSDGRVPC